MSTAEIQNAVRKPSANDLSGLKTSAVNPFVEYHPSSFWKMYSSDENYRIVWIKGKEAKAADLGSAFCPVMRFDTVAFVWMHTRFLPIPLVENQFVSVEELPLEINLSFNARVLPGDFALISISTSFEHTLKLLAENAAAILYEACKTRTIRAISENETFLSDQIIQFLVKADDRIRLPLELLDAHLKIRCTAASTILRDGNSEALRHSLEEQRSHRARALAVDIRKRELAELAWKLDADWRTFERSQNKLRLSAKTAGQIKEAELERLKQMDSLCIEAKLVAVQDPALRSSIAKLEEARITNDGKARETALTQTLDQLKLLAEFSRSANPNGGQGVVTVVNHK